MKKNVKIKKKCMSHIIILEVTQFFGLVPKCILLKQKQVNTHNYKQVVIIASIVKKLTYYFLNLKTKK